MRTPCRKEAVPVVLVVLFDLARCGVVLITATVAGFVARLVMRGEWSGSIVVVV